MANGDQIQTPTLLRWLVAALGAAVLAGGAFWMHTIDERIKEAVIIGERNSDKLINIQIEMVAHGLKIEQLRRQVDQVEGAVAARSGGKP